MFSHSIIFFLYSKSFCFSSSERSLQRSRPCCRFFLFFLKNDFSEAFNCHCSLSFSCVLLPFLAPSSPSSIFHLPPSSPLCSFARRFLFLGLPSYSFYPSSSYSSYLLTCSWTWTLPWVLASPAHCTADGGYVIDRTNRICSGQQRDYIDQWGLDQQGFFQIGKIS